MSITRTPVCRYKNKNGGAELKAKCHAPKRYARVALDVFARSGYTWECYAAQRLHAAVVNGGCRHEVGESAADKRKSQEAVYTGQAQRVVYIRGNTRGLVPLYNERQRTSDIFASHTVTTFQKWRMYSSTYDMGVYFL